MKGAPFLSFSGFSLIQPEGLTRESSRYLDFPPSADWIPAFAGMTFLGVDYALSGNDNSFIIIQYVRIRPMG
jgi:hypothetical protein